MSYFEKTDPKMGKFVNAVLTNGTNGHFLVDPRDNVIGQQLRRNGVYGQLELERLSKITDKDSSVLVVGAHIGTLAIPLAKSVKRVVAIEANPSTFELLRFNVLLNGAENCTLHNIAASNKFEPLEFLVNTENSGGSKIRPRIENKMYTYDNPEIISVPGAPLDQILLPEEFDVIIMDIEGSEYFALQGMPELLNKAHSIMIEFVPHHIRNISGVTVKEFAELFNCFETMSLTYQDLTVAKGDFEFVLDYLFEKDICDDGLIFSR